MIKILNKLLLIVIAVYSEIIIQDTFILISVETLSLEVKHELDALENVIKDDKFYYFHRIEYDITTRGHMTYLTFKE